MDNVRRLHRPELGMSKGSLPIAKHRQADRWGVRLRDSELHGRLFRLQPNQDESNGPMTAFMTNT
ncbi:hypothetical protein A2U01_0058592, partial [Trifolium medium]|nr:hypothetical protein [Trifolium medium]